MRIFFPPEYPVKPPKVRFTCDMFHPNGAITVTTTQMCAMSYRMSVLVYNDGVLCLDIIQDQWKPIYTTANILLSVQVYMCIRMTHAKLPVAS